MPVKKGLVEENVSTKVLAALSTAFGREISFVDDLTYAEYETELREAMLKVHPDRGGDEETFQILSEERDRIRKRNSEIVPKEKKTTIKGVKLLPGTTFRSDDIKPADVDKDSSESSTVNIADRLNNIADALAVIGGLFKLELKALQDKETQDRKDKADQDKKARESELEAKKGTEKKKKDTGLKIPGKGIIGNLQRFFTNVALGAASIKVLDWLKDPANQKNVTKVATWLKDNAKTIFTGLFVLAGLDIASKVLLLARGVASVLVWMGGAPLLIGAIILALGTLGTLKAKKDYDMTIKSMEEEAIQRGFVHDDGRPDLKALTVRHDFETKKRLNPDDELIQGTTWEEYLNNRKNAFEKLWGIFDNTHKIDEVTYKNAMKGMAKGGRPPVGEVVTVGEMGRELFVADTSGTIIPNDKSEHVFDGGALLVAKSNTMDKVSGISQRVSKKRTPNLIDLRGGKGSTSNPTFNTGDQISSVSSEDSSNIDIFTGSLSYGLVG